MRLVLAALLLSGCVHGRVALHERFDPSKKPSYVDYFDGYLFGFIGSPSVSLARVCMDQKPYGVQKYKSGEDYFLRAITLGIYAPTTVKVWCGE